VEFHKDGDIKCQVSWNEYNEEWRMLIRDYKLGSTLYRHKYHPNVRIDECHGVPKDSWQVWFGKAPAPSIRYVPIDEVISPQVQTDSDTSGVNVSDKSEETSNTVHEQQQTESIAACKKSEFIELHPQWEIISPEDRARQTRDTEVASTSGPIQVSLGGEKIVETADGLFSAQEAMETADGRSSPEPNETHRLELAAKAWLEGIGSAPAIPSSVEEVMAAKAASQDLYKEGKLGDARQATSAAILAIRKLRTKLDSDHTGDDQECVGVPQASMAELDEMLGVLHSNRSLITQQLIQGGDAEVLAFGMEAAWKLVVVDTSAALSVNPSNFKASFRRAGALFELGELEDALTDATLVVDHYVRHSAVPNPDAADLRDRILEAIRKERGKWGNRRQTRWNRVTQKPLITEMESDSKTHDSLGVAADSKLSSRPSPWAADHSAPCTEAPKVAVVARRAPPPPKNGGDVEKALLGMLKKDPDMQLAYVREHLPATSINRFFGRKAPLGPDLLALLIQILGELPETETPFARETLNALASTPSARTHAAMFDAGERLSLKRLVERVGPDAAVAWFDAGVGAGGA